MYQVVGDNEGYLICTYNVYFSNKKSYKPSLCIHNTYIILIVWRPLSESIARLLVIQFPPVIFSLKAGNDIVVVRGHIYQYNPLETLSVWRYCKQWLLKYCILSQLLKCQCNSDTQVSEFQRCTVNFTRSKNSLHQSTLQRGGTVSGNICVLDLEMTIWPTPLIFELPFWPWMKGQTGQIYCQYWSLHTQFLIRS